MQLVDSETYEWEPVSPVNSPELGRLGDHFDGRVDSPFRKARPGGLQYRRKHRPKSRGHDPPQNISCFDFSACTTSSSSDCVIYNASNLKSASDPQVQTPPVKTVKAAASSHDSCVINQGRVAQLRKLFLSPEEATQSRKLCLRRVSKPTGSPATSLKGSCSDKSIRHSPATDNEVKSKDVQHSSTSCQTPIATLASASSTTEVKIVACAVTPPRVGTESSDAEAVPLNQLDKTADDNIDCQSPLCTSAPLTPWRQPRLPKAQVSPLVYTRSKYIAVHEGVQTSPTCLVDTPPVHKRHSSMDKISLSLKDSGCSINTVCSLGKPIPMAQLQSPLAVKIVRSARGKSPRRSTSALRRSMKLGTAHGSPRQLFPADSPARIKYTPGKGRRVPSRHARQVKLGVKPDHLLGASRKKTPKENPYSCGNIRAPLGMQTIDSSDISTAFPMRWTPPSQGTCNRRLHASGQVSVDSVSPALSQWSFTGDVLHSRPGLNDYTTGDNLRRRSISPQSITVDACTPGLLLTPQKVQAPPEDHNNFTTPSRPNVQGLPAAKEACMISLLEDDSERTSGTPMSLYIPTTPTNFSMKYSLSPSPSQHYPALGSVSYQASAETVARRESVSVEKDTACSNPLHTRPIGKYRSLTGDCQDIHPSSGPSPRSRFMSAPSLNPFQQRRQARNLSQPSVFSGHGRSGRHLASNSVESRTHSCCSLSASPVPSPQPPGISSSYPETGHVFFQRDECDRRLSLIPQARTATNLTGENAAHWYEKVEDILSSLRLETGHNGRQPKVSKQAGSKSAPCTPPHACDISNTPSILTEKLSPCFEDLDSTSQRLCHVDPSYSSSLGASPASSFGVNSDEEVPSLLSPQTSIGSDSSTGSARCAVGFHLRPALNNGRRPSDARNVASTADDNVLQKYRSMPYDLYSGQKCRSSRRAKFYSPQSSPQIKKSGPRFCFPVAKSDTVVHNDCRAVHSDVINCEQPSATFQSRPSEMPSFPVSNSDGEPQPIPPKRPASTLPAHDQQLQTSEPEKTNKDHKHKGARKFAKTLLKYSRPKVLTSILSIQQNENLGKSAPRSALTHFMPAKAMSLDTDQNVLPLSGWKTPVDHVPPSSVSRLRPSASDVDRRASTLCLLRPQNSRMSETSQDSYQSHSSRCYHASSSSGESRLPRLESPISDCVGLMTSSTKPVPPPRNIRSPSCSVFVA